MSFQRSAQETGIGSSQTEPALWERFARAAGAEAYGGVWLALQCSLIPKTVQGVVVLGDPEKASFSPIATWPEEGQEPERLAEISERVLQEGCGLLAALCGDRRSEPGGPSDRYAVAYPILVDGRTHGAVAIEVATDLEEELKAAMAQLQWGVSGMELLFRRRQVQAEEALVLRLRSAVDLLAGVLSTEAFDAACMAFVTELATLAKCDRVSLAFLHRDRARIQAVSHSAEFGERMNLIRAIAAAMEEAVLQRKDIFYPPPREGEILIVRDHEALARQHGAGSILTLPFYGSERYCGVLTLERPSGEPFGEEEAEFCRSVGSLLLPALEIKRQNDRSLILKVLDAAKAEAGRLLGPRHLGRKLVLLLCALAVLFFYTATGEYRIASHTILEGAVRRVVVTPFDGYVKDAPVRAGDVVEQGTLLCTLDDRDLRLERINWLSKRTQFERQHQEALAQHDRAKAEILKAQLDQAAAQLRLVESQLERTRMTAPFRGLVISGDLSQRLGGAVGKGEVLFEVAPLDAYRVILEVDERRIADVKPGQRGRMILSSLPREDFDFVVEKLTPISMAKEGKNYFRVEARMERISERLRPGMEGVGKIEVDRRKLFAIWTRDAREWVSMWVWSWWP